MDSSTTGTSPSDSQAPRTPPSDAATSSAATSDAATVVRQLWEHMEARNWSGLGELLAADAVVEWPASGERIVGRDNYVSINAEYPEGWSIRVLRIVAEGEQAVSEVQVPHESMGVYQVASFWTVRDGRIVAGREYWSERGADPSPAWRANWVEPLDQH